jgi:two-component system, NtrC family, response regulator PilR
VKGAKILIVDDDRSIRELLTILFESDGYQVESASSAEEALRIFSKASPDLVLSDLNMPGLSGLELIREVKVRDPNCFVVVVTGFGSTESAVEAMKLGAANYVLKPFNNDELRLVVQRALGVKALEKENRRLREDKERLHFGCLVGGSSAMQEVYSLIRRIKDKKINCMIIGESGTGKELVARAIHNSGERANNPFVAINCGAIPVSLMESELFGHKKGSFTGAIRDKIGLIQAAHKGTLFLDEVDSLPLAEQVKLLRVIQERRFIPIGAVREVEVDVRLIAATNQDLETLVRDGRFRDDLFYRLNVVEIPLPPLRERGDDLEELVRYFIEKYRREYGKSIVGISPKALSSIGMFPLPGNVRELQNMIERAVALCPSSVIQEADLPSFSKQLPRKRDLSPPRDFPPEGINLDALLSGLEKSWLVSALEASDGRKGKAAELLQISFRSFRYRLDKYRMD